MTDGKVWLCLLSLFISIALTLAALSTMHWYDTSVDRQTLMQLYETAAGNSSEEQALQNNPAYYSRHRGMFKTCYESSYGAYMLESFQSMGTNTSNCVQDSGITSLGDTTNESARNHLLRTAIAGVILQLLLLVMGIVVIALGICGDFTKQKLSTVWVLAGASLSIVLTMVIFTTLVTKIETSLISSDGLPIGWRALPEYADLANNTTSQFGYSFIVGWVSVFTTLLGTFLLILSRRETKSPKRIEMSKQGVSLQFQTRPSFDNPEVTTLDERTNRKKLNTGKVQKKDSIYTWGYAGKEEDDEESHFGTNKLGSTARGSDDFF